MKIAIVGSRTFNDYERMCSFIGEHLDFQELGSIEAVVSGGAKEADTLAEQFARAMEQNMTWNSVKRCPSHVLCVISEKK